MSYAAEGHPHWIPASVRSPRLAISEDAVEGLAPGEREAALRLFGDYERILREARLQAYEPAGFKHHRFHLARERVRLFAGGNRSGKTTSGVVDDVIQVTPHELLPDHLRGYREMNCPARVRIVTPNLTRGGAPIKEALAAYLPRQLLKGGSFKQAWKTREETVWLECGCMIELLSCEQDVIAHGGTARERIHYDEEPTQAHRIENTMRLASVQNGHELFTFTPLEGLSWTYKELWKHRHEPGRWGEQVGMRDNRFLRDDDVDYVLSVITNDAERRQREHGEFAERGGQVYPAFLDARRPQLVREQVSAGQVFVGIDPGLRNAGFVWALQDRDGKLFVFACAILARKDVADYAELCKRVASAWQFDWRKARYVIDPAARSGNAVTGESVLDALTLYGIYAEPGQNDVELGIQTVRQRLRLGALEYSDELVGLEDEAVEYAIKADNPDGTEPRFQVIKRNDHRLDALRYLVMQTHYDPKPLRGQLDGIDRAFPPEPKKAPGSKMGALV